MYQTAESRTHQERMCGDNKGFNSAELQTRDVLRWTGVVCLIVLLAGCNGLSASTPDRVSTTQTVTPAPVPEERSRPLLRTAVSTNGTVDPKRLAQTHKAVLANRSYTLTYIRNETANRPSAVARNTTNRIQVGRQATQVEVSGLRELRDRQRYFTDSAGYEYVAAFNRTRRLETTRSDIEPTLATELIKVHLPGQSRQQTTITESDQRYLRVHVPKTAEIYAGDRYISDYTVTAYVHPSGYVRSMRVNYTDTSRGVDISLRFRYTAVGETSVKRPAWVPEDERTPGAVATGEGT